MSSDTINRPALGRPASLGDLYNIRSETFKDIMIFKKHPIPPSVFKTVESPRVDVDMQFLDTESFSEKFGKLKVSADFSLSLLAGYVPLSSGTGKYLQQEKMSSRAATTTLMYSMETVVDTLNINSEELEEFVCQKTLSETDATHVVIRVDWGANVFISFQDTSNSGNNSKSLSTKLEATFKKIGTSVNGIGKSVNDDKTEHLSLRVYGDISPENGRIPQTTKEAYDFIQTIPRLAKASNAGKGKPISYGLLPISVIRKQFGMTTEKILWKEVTDDVSQRVLYFFDHLLELKQKLTDLYDDVTQYSYCLTGQNISQVKKKQQELLIFESKAKSQLRDIIVKVREGQGDRSSFEDLLSDLSIFDGKDSKNEIALIQEFLESKEDISNQIVWIKTLISKNVLPIGTGDVKTVEAATAGRPSGENQVNKVFIYVFNSQTKGDDSRACKNRKLFLQLLSSHEGKAKFYFTNTDVHPISSVTEPGKSVSIYCFINGDLNCEDWLDTTEKKLQIPIIGSYKLKNNGQFGTYLSELGIWGPHYYTILMASCTLAISENQGVYKIDINTIGQNFTQTFQLNKPFSEKTAIDNKDAQCIMTRDLNRLILKQTLNDGSKRVVIREFTDKQLIVTLKLLPGKKSGKDISVTRTFDRIRK